MAFVPLKLTTKFGAQQIKSVDEAIVAGLDLSTQNAPHWQIVRQALHIAAVSESAEDLAWRESYRLLSEGWLAT